MKKLKKYRSIVSTFPLLIFLMSACESNAIKNSEINSTVSTDIEDLKSMAESKFNQDKYEDAIPIYSKLIERDSLNGEYYYKRGSSLAGIYNYEHSARDYKRAAELNYRTHDSYYNIGVINMFVYMDTASARLFFKKALDIKPTSKETIEMLNTLREKQLNLNLK